MSESTNGGKGRGHLAPSTTALRYGTTGAALRLNERLRALDGVRWRPNARGDVLTAIDRQGREVADLIFINGGEEQG